MKAAICASLDGPDAIEIRDLEMPSAGPGEVAVRVSAAALNFMDTLITRGKYQFKPQLPFSPAAEICGRITGLGVGVDQFQVGDRVCGYIDWGGAREHLAVNADKLVRVPDDVGDHQAAAVNVTYGTAMHGLADRGRLSAGEFVAVLGASGGAGLAAVEIAKLLDAQVIAVASSAEKLALCNDAGADLLLDYTQQDLKQGLRDLTDGRGVDVIYDCVGGPSAEQALRSIAWMGRFLVVGFAGGEIPKIPLNLLLLKSCDMAGVFWGEAVTRDRARHRRNMSRVLEWVAEGRLRPHIGGVFALEQISEAIKMLDARAARGKLIIDMAK